MGRHAVELALAQVRGQPVPPVTTIPTELVIRRSCGCFPAADEGAAPPGRNTITLQPSTKPDAPDPHPAPAEGPPTRPNGWADRLLAGFLDEVNGRTSGTFLPLLAEYVSASLETGGEPTRWWQAMFEVRRLALPTGTDPANLTRAEDLWLRVQLLLTDITHRLGDYQHMLDGWRDQTVREAGQLLISVRDVDEFAAALASQLPRLGIPSCYVGAYASIDAFGTPGPAANKQ